MGLGMGGKKPHKSRLSRKKVNRGEDEEATESDEGGEEAEVAVSEEDAVEVISPPSKGDREERLSNRQAASSKSNPLLKRTKLVCKPKTPEQLVAVDNAASPTEALAAVLPASAFSSVDATTWNTGD